MKPWQLLRKRSASAASDLPDGDDSSGAESLVELPTDQPQQITGERGIGSINRARSLQSRVTQMLGMGLFGAIGLGVLGWYYVQAFSEGERKPDQTSRSLSAQAQSEMPLPPLGALPRVAPMADVELAYEEESMEDIPPAWLEPAREEPVPVHVPVQRTPEELALERKLSGAAFLRASDSGDDAGMVRAEQPAVGGANAVAGESSRGSELDELLVPSVTPAVAARVLPTRRLLLPKGSFLDCTLETAIDSSLPGMTTCITATDTFGADATTVLLERGTKLVGETRGELRQGQSRLFVLWSEARTPTGVVIPLASPGTDALGRSGVTGVVDTHFADRFGAAILISVIDGAVQSMARPRGQSAVTVNPSSSADIMTEVLRSTVDIPPTLRVANGSQLQVLVARDLDFRTVYRLVPQAAGGAR